MTVYSEDLGLTIWAANQASPQVPTNAGWTIALILQSAGVAKGTTTPPGSPAEGDFYIIGNNCTGAWAGWAQDSLAVYHNGGWVNLTPVDRMIVRIDDGAGKSTTYQYEGAGSPNEWTIVIAPGSASIPYDIPCTYAGTPTSGEVITRYEMVRSVDFAADFAGSSGSVETNPDSAYVIDVQDDGASIGTISISTAGAFTFATTSGTAKTVAASSKVEFVAPTGSPTETSIAGISVTLFGSVTVAL